METLANLESFLKSARLGSFTEAARRLALTPAAVSRNVASLERNLGFRLFHRSTRQLALTEAGKRLLNAIGDPLDTLQSAIAEASATASAPAGVLKLSLAPMIGVSYILPLLADFMSHFPLIRPEWHFDTRPVDLLAEGYDAAIGGGFSLPAGHVARTLAPAHLVAVAAPAYLATRRSPAEPADLAGLEGVVLRSLRTGRVEARSLRNAHGAEVPVLLPQNVVVNDVTAMREAARLGLGVAIMALPDVLADLEHGRLVRLLPGWHVDVGSIALYYAARRLLPAKTRAFVDYITEAAKRERWAERFAGGPHLGDAKDRA